MAFDGITISCLRKELDELLSGGHICKIAQPEADEILLTIKNNREQYRLLLSASASLPLVYLTDKNKTAPATAPNFCMLLRKYIGSGKIISITQPDFERVLSFEIEHRNELGDLCTKKLIIEIMGKHSNIIFCTAEDMILDSIKHISCNMSSVREVLPGRPYFIPKTTEKYNPLSITEDAFFNNVLKKPVSIGKALYTSLTGFSPIMAEETAYRASIDGGLSTDALSDLEKMHLFHTFLRIMEDIKDGAYSPQIYYKDKVPVEYAVFSLSQYTDHDAVRYDDASTMLREYYASRSVTTRIRQKSVDLRKIVTTHLERDSKKLNLQLKQMQDTKKKDKYRIYGELLNTYGYSLEEGASVLETINYYTGEPISVPLDPTLSPSENAKKYFDKYGKLKRTEEALSVQLEETQKNTEHLQSILTALDLAVTEDDLSQIRNEMEEYGYVKKSQTKGKKQPKLVSMPLHFQSIDGFDIYVGKNNYQNEELSFKIASGNDWWFHAKKTPGSHVIIKNGGQEMSDAAFEEAGRLAAYYSSARQAPKVEIDYTLKKNLKKVNGGAPGFVVYHTNYSLMVSPDITGIKEIN